MDFQHLSVASKLEGWIKDYRRMLGDRIINYAIELGVKCVHACSTISEQRDQPRMHPFPKEAVLEITKFGLRFRGRPSTARPFYWAAYLLRDVLTDQSEAIYAYLDALLGKSLDPWEFRKHIRDCSRRAKRGAKKIQELELQGVTLEILEQRIKEAKDFVEGAKREKAILPGGLDRVVKEAQAKKELYDKIKVGFFDDKSPNVFVRSSRSVGSYQFGGQNFNLKDSSVSFEIYPHVLNAPLEWSCIMVLPIWYDEWKGCKILN